MRKADAATIAAIETAMGSNRHRKSIPRPLPPPSSGGGFRLRRPRLKMPRIQFPILLIALIENVCANGVDEDDSPIAKAYRFGLRYASARLGDCPSLVCARFSDAIRDPSAQTGTVSLPLPHFHHRQRDVRRALGVVVDGLVGYAGFGVQAEVAAGVGVAVELREVAAGYFHADTMPRQEANAG